MTQERKAEAQEDASVSAMTPGSTHPKKPPGRPPPRVVAGCFLNVLWRRCRKACSSQCRCEKGNRTAVAPVATGPRQVAL